MSATITPVRIDPPLIEAPVRSDTGAVSLPWVRYHQSVADRLVQVTQGVVDGGDATAGQIGEFISSAVAGPGGGIGNNVMTNVTSLPLTAGDWDVRGEVWFHLGTGPTGACEAGISTFSATIPGDPGLGSRVTQTFVHTANSGQVLALAPCRFSLSAAATVYLVALCGFSGGSTTAFGTISARRVR